MAFEKGKSGNPGGRPKDKAFANAVRVAVNRTDAEGRKKLTLLADKLVDYALAGEGWAFAQIGDRLDGKPAQESTVHVARARAAEISDDDLADIAAGGGTGATSSPVDPSQLN